MRDSTETSCAQSIFCAHLCPGAPNLRLREMASGPCRLQSLQLRAWAPVLLFSDGVIVTGKLAKELFLGKKLLGAPGIASNKDTTRGSWPYY